MTKQKFNLGDKVWFYNDTNCECYDNICSMKLSPDNNCPMYSFLNGYTLYEDELFSSKNQLIISTLKKEIQNTKIDNERCIEKIKSNSEYIEKLEHKLSGWMPNSKNDGGENEREE